MSPPQTRRVISCRSGCRCGEKCRWLALAADPERFAGPGATPFLPVQHRAIQERRSPLSRASVIAVSVRAINQWVFENLLKTPTIGVPNALESSRFCRATAMSTPP